MVILALMIIGARVHEECNTIWSHGRSGSSEDKRANGPGVRIGEASNPGPRAEDGPIDIGRCPRRPEGGGLPIATANGTGWVPIRAWLRECRHDILCVQEHRQMHREDVDAASEVAKNIGWKSMWTPAVRSQHEAGEASGGTAIFIRDHLGARAPPGGAEVYPGHCTAALIDAGGTGGVVCYSVYLRCGDELNGFNWALLTAIAGHARAHGLPCVFGGDWNVTPEALAHSGWVAAIGAIVVRAPVTHTVTIRGRPGRHIDYFVITKELASLGLSAAVDGSAPIRTHNAVMVEVPARPRSYHVTVMKSARKMPQNKPIGPRKRPAGADDLLERARATTKMAMSSGGGDRAKGNLDALMKEWLAHAEEELIMEYHLDEQPAELQAYRGRAEGPRFVREPLLGAARKKSHAEAGAESRRLRQVQDRAYEVAAALDRWSARPDGKEVRERAKAAIDAGHHVHASAPTDNASGAFGGELKALGRRAERWARTDYGDANDAHADAVKLRAEAWRIGEAAREAADARHAENAKEVRQSITDWCRRAEANGAALAHRWTKLPTAWREETTELVEGEITTTTTNPDAIVDAEYAKWASLWAPPRGDEDLPDWGEVPQLPRPDVAEMRAGARRFKRTTGQGIDQIGPRDLGDLPDDTLDTLCEIMYCAELLGVVPGPIAMVVVVLLQKKDGGRRPIGLMPSAYRLWMRVRQRHVRAWEAQWDRRYLAAARGKSAADAAWLRSLRAEYATASGTTAASILWDLRKCFEHGSYTLLATETKQLLFPVAVARLSVAMYTSERRLRLDKAFSAAITPTRGYIAGCTNALASIKATMIRRMDAYIRRNPSVDVDIYVDDIEMQSIGPRAATVDALVKAAKDMQDVLTNHLGYPLAHDKAVVVANDREVAEEIVRGTDGMAGTAKAVTEKLGVEYTSGARRPARGGPRRARYCRQLMRNRRVGKLKRLGCKVINVVRRGQQAAATYGGEVHGVSDHELETLRAMASAALPPATRGTSRTLKLLTAYDPAVDANGKLMLQWASAIWRACGPAATRRRTDPTPVLMDAALKKANSELKKSADGGWSTVAGPAMAAVLTARRIGWEYITAFKVSDERNNVIDMAVTDPASVRISVDRATRASAARSAASKEGIGGPEGEVWVEPVRRALGGRMSPPAKSALRRAFTGGYWTNARRFQAGLCASPDCDKCGKYDDMGHRIWDCDGIGELRDDQTTENMRERARQAPRDCPYWTRGLAANPWRSLRPPRRDYEEHWFFAAGVEEDRTFTGKVYSDGSAMAPQCPEARRAGWAVVQLAGDGTVSKAVYGHVPAPESSSQTAGAGEVYAVRRAHELAVGELVVTADYQALLDGASAGEKPTTASKKANAASWRGIWRATDGMRPDIRKVKAHRTFAEALRSEEPEAVAEWRGNRAADLYAKQGARQHYRGCGDSAFRHYEGEYERLAEVCRWIGTALAQWPRASAGKRASTKKRGEQAAATKRARRRAAAEGNGHRLVRDRDGWKCLTCGRGAVAEKGARKLAMGRCEGHTGSRVGRQGSSPSAHTLWAAEADPSQVGKMGTLPPDIVWCSKCGGYSSTKLYKLGTVCSGVLQRAAQDRLGWINRGRHPVHKHLLSPPVRLTDAVIAALGEGAAARKAAFNALLRGEPRQDQGGGAKSPDGGPRQAGDHDDLHDVPHWQLAPLYDDPMHDDDVDVFGHGGGLSGDEDAPRTAVGTSHGMKRTLGDATAQLARGPDRGEGRGASSAANVFQHDDHLANGAVSMGDGQGNMPGSSTDHLNGDMALARLDGMSGGRAAQGGAGGTASSADGGSGGAADGVGREPGAKRRRGGGYLTSVTEPNGVDGGVGRDKIRDENGAPASTLARGADEEAMADAAEGGNVGRGDEPGGLEARTSSPGRTCRVRGVGSRLRPDGACPALPSRRGDDGDCHLRNAGNWRFKRRRLHGKQCTASGVAGTHASMQVGDVSTDGRSAHDRLVEPSHARVSRRVAADSPAVDRQFKRRRIRGKQSPAVGLGGGLPSALRPARPSAVDQHGSSSTGPWPHA